MAFLEEVRQAITTVADEVGDSVVGVGRRLAVGSGVVIAEGRVLTNAHNLRGDEVTITFGDGSSTTGRAAGVDVDGDIAVVAGDTDGASACEWHADAPSPTIGTPVFALANPGGRGLRVTFGFVTGTARSFRGPRGRRITGGIEHSSPLLPGSSGGPIVDASGHLMGINTNRLGEGFYLALPADAGLKSRVDGLSRGESPARPRLGIGIAPSHVAQGLRRAVGLPDARGLLVRTVERGSPAERAGLSEGDLIVAAGGRDMATPDDLFDAVAGADRSLELRLLRGSEERSAAVVLG